MPPEESKSEDSEDESADRCQSDSSSGEGSMAEVGESNPDAEEESKEPEIGGNLEYQGVCVLAEELTKDSADDEE
jgi:hypothetical protein